MPPVHRKPSEQTPLTTLKLATEMSHGGIKWLINLMDIP